MLGTAAYMAPEQAKGKAVDKRADIWAFGCVLYEMLTGRRAFEGEDISDTLAFVITKEPEWTALPATVPGPIRRLLRRCLAKDRKRRLADISDARLELEETATASPDSVASSVADVTRVGWRRSIPWMIAAGVGAALVALLLTWAPWRRAAPSAPLRLSVDLGAGVPSVPGLGFPPAFALSPDGKVLAFTAAQKPGGRPMIHVRRLDHLSASPLSGTDDAAGPFFSPDGQWLAFFADGKLRKIPVTGGAAITLADARNPRGGTWAEDGTIVFTPDRADTSLMRVADVGGQPQPLTSLAEREAVQRWPQVLPSARAVLYTSHISTSGFDAADLVIQPLPTGARKVVLRGGYHGPYVASGHLMASTLTAGAQLAVSRLGTLVYQPGQIMTRAGPVVWLGREGRETPLRAAFPFFENLEFSPDGHRLTMDIYDGLQWDMWVYEWQRDRLSRLTFEGNQGSRCGRQMGGESPSSPDVALTRPRPSPGSVPTAPARCNGFSRTARSHCARVRGIRPAGSWLSASALRRRIGIS